MPSKYKICTKCACFASLYLSYFNINVVQPQLVHNWLDPLNNEIHMVSDPGQYLSEIPLWFVNPVCLPVTIKVVQKALLQGGDQEENWQTQGRKVRQ